MERLLKELSVDEDEPLEQVCLNLAHLSAPKRDAAPCKLKAYSSVVWLS
jgi:hypothetical protein